MASHGSKSSHSSMLSVTVADAHLTSSVAVFGHMNLSAELKCGPVAFRTREIQGNDENPTWDEEMQLSVSATDSLLVRVLHKTLIRVDAEVGSCSVPVPDLKRRPDDMWTLWKGKTQVGWVRLRLNLGDCSPSPPRVPRSALGVADLRTELLKKLSDLEREKEEVQLQKENNQRKMQQLADKKRAYRARIQALDVRQISKTDRGTECAKLLSPSSQSKLSLSEDLTQRQQSLNFRETRLIAERKHVEEERKKLSQERGELLRRKDTVVQMKAAFSRERQSMRKSLRSETQRPMAESGSDEHIRKLRPLDLDHEWNEIDHLRVNLNEKQRVLELNRQKPQEEMQLYKEELEQFEQLRQRATRQGSSDARTGRGLQRSVQPKSYSTSTGGEQRGRV